MRIGSWIMVVGLLASGAACAHGRRTTGSRGPLAPDAAPVTVFVTNNYSIAMDVIALGDAANFDLGTVAPGIVSHFVLDPALLATGGHVRFMAQATAYGERVTSDQLLLSPGDTVDFRIATQLVNSAATVRQ